MATTTTAAAGDDDLIERKKATRRRVRAALKELTETQMSAESTAICASLLSTLQIFKETSDACVQRPLRLGLYVHCAKLREVDTRPLLKTALALGDACEVYVPIVDAPADGNDGVGPAMRFLQIQNLDKGEFIFILVVCAIRMTDVIVFCLLQTWSRRRWGYWNRPSSSSTA